MTFEFFNTSNLAFGSKITSAFNTLNDLAKDAEDNLAQVFEDQAYFNQFRNKNYQVPIPMNLTAPCRTDELYTLVDDSVVIKQFEYSNDTLKVKINLFDKASDRYTIASGETSLKAGYAYVPLSISNLDASKIINFTEDKEALKGTLLFQFRIDYNNTINIIGSTSTLKLEPFDFTQYKSLSIGENLTLPYTAKEPECVCVVGERNSISFSINDKEVLSGAGGNNVRHAIAYLKKGDKISGNLSSAFHVKYNT